MNIELQSMCKEAIAAYCDVIFRNFSVDNEATTKML
jgi:hypothetical protein